MDDGFARCVYWRWRVSREESIHIIGGFLTAENVPWASPSGAQWVVAEGSRGNGEKCGDFIAPFRTIIATIYGVTLWFLSLHFLSIKCISTLDLPTHETCAPTPAQYYITS